MEKCDCIQLHKEGCKPNTISYLITTSCLNKNKEYVHKLFTCGIKCTRNTVVATVLKKVDGKDGNLNIIILTRDKVGRNYSYRLLSENQPVDYNNEFDLLPMTNNDPMSPLIKEFIDFGKVNDDWTIKYENPNKLHCIV